MITTRRPSKNMSKDEENPTDSTVQKSPVSLAFDEFKEISLELIYYEMKLQRQDLSTKIDHCKEDIIIKVENENRALQEEIKQLKVDLKAKDEKIQSLTADLENVKKQLEEAPKVTTVDVASECYKSEEFISMERDVIDLQQYIRRNNVEVCNLPESIGDDDLEDTIINIGKAVDIEINSEDIEAVHRLKKRFFEAGPRRTIARFKNRKISEALIRCSKEFSNDDKLEAAGLSNRIYINSNLSSYNRFLWGKSKALLRDRKIHKFWTTNGNVCIRINENDRPKRIGHINDLVDLFPDCEYLQQKKNDDTL